MSTTLEEGLGRSGTELIVREICAWRKKIDDATAIAEDNPFSKGTGTNSAVLRNSGSTASGELSIAIGMDSTAAGLNSYAEGGETTASGSGSHAEGEGTVASGLASHAGGRYTIAKAQAQTAIGEYNIQDDNNEFYLIVGNGTSTTARNNAFTVSKTGELMMADGMRVKEDSSDDEAVIKYDSTNKCLKFVFE